MDKNRYFQIRSGKHIKIKVTDIQRLYSKWLWLVTVVYKPSFAVDNIGKQHYVFNIKGNDFRMVAVIKFTIRFVYIRFIGTHEEYDRIDCRNI